MAATSHTGTAGSTVWCTDVGWQRVQHYAGQLPKRGGRGAGGQVSEIVRQWLIGYRDRVSKQPRGDRPCFVGTLFGYPGAASSGRRTVDPQKPGKNKVRRIDELRQDGSKRVYLGPSARELLSAVVPFGLVLPHQRVQTRPTGVSAHPSDDSEGRVLRTARPLSDVILTAIVLESGPLPDGPLAGIERQLLRQETAARLWNVAHIEGADVRATQAALRGFLPQLLLDDIGRIAALRGLLPGWTGTLEDLVQAVDACVPRHRREQKSLLSAGVPV
jgi:hypothetical protein